MKQLIAGNWKMNHGPVATGDFFGELNALIGKQPAQTIKADLCIAAPSISLPAALFGTRLVAMAGGPPIALAAQNAHGAEKGAFTGELSAAMLKEVGAVLSLVGHSERRTLFSETDELISARARGLLTQGVSVIYCIGETLAEREANQTEAVLERQLKHVPWDAAAIASGAELILAYEPVWAIGTGKTATPEQAQAAHAFVRQQLPPALAVKTRILYGGSVTPENAAILLACPDVNGALVGGASLKAASFLAIAQAAR